MGFVEKLWQSDLAGHDATILEGMRSVSSNFGFHSTVLAGNSHKSAIFMNRVVERGGTFGANAKFVGEAGQAHASKAAAMATYGMKDNAFNRTMFGAGLRGNSLFHTLNIGFTAIDGISGYRAARRAGDSRLQSAGAGLMSMGKMILMQKAAGIALRNPVTAVGAAAIGAGLIAAKTTLNSIEVGNRYKNQAHLSELSGNSSGAMHTRAAATMRQRALSSINNSQFNSMRALGNEASFIHMPRSRYGNSNQGANPTPILGY